MAEVVYVLCALMSLVCAVLLLRAWSQRRVKLLFWSGLCFVGFAVGNAMLVVDKLVTGPNTDLILFRTLPILLGLSVLLYGMIWGTQ